ESHLRRVATGPAIERLLRLDSNLLPAYTHPVARWMYDETLMRELVETGLGEAGRIAREGDVRLSFHPGPFCVLASANPAAVENGVREMEYHADLLRGMGCAGGWHRRGARESDVPGHAADALPDFGGLVASGVSARNLRAHSDLMWNEAVNAWAAAHLVWADLEVEAKLKNLASHQLATVAAQRLAA